MISEVTLAKKFTSFWNHLLPNANHFIRLINKGLVEICYEPFENTQRRENISLINVLSFNLFKAIIKKEIRRDALIEKNFYNTDFFNTKLTLSLIELERFSKKSAFSLPLNDKELKDVFLLFNQIYYRYYEKIGFMEVSPAFQGCGFVNRSEGDIHFEKTLVELKSGERNFSVTDIRQVLIYCTLNHYATGKKREIESIELFNPRMGIAYKSTIKDLSKNLSALSPEDLFFEIQLFITENNFIEAPGI